MNTPSTKLKAQYIHPRYRNSKKRKKIGFDLHGVVDSNSVFFRSLMGDLIKQGWEVHIITGASWAKERTTLKKLKIPFTHFFSIVDHHTTIGTGVIWDDKGDPHLDPSHWDRTKGIYCDQHGIHMHFDDSDIYGLYFKTPYVRYFSKDSERIRKLHNS